MGLSDFDWVINSGFDLGFLMQRFTRFAPIAIGALFASCKSSFCSMGVGFGHRSANRCSLRPKLAWVRTQNFEPMLAESEVGVGSDPKPRTDAR
jgi:hypothetical protein